MCFSFKFCHSYLYPLIICYRLSCSSQGHFMPAKFWQIGGMPSPHFLRSLPRSRGTPFLHYPRRLWRLCILPSSQGRFCSLIIWIMELMEEFGIPKRTFFMFSGACSLTMKFQSSKLSNDAGSVTS